MAKFDIKTVKPKFVVTTSPENKIDVVVNKPIIETKLSKSFFKLKNTGGPVGPRGPQGERGEQGLPGERGPEGLPGRDGRDGVDGQDGQAATIGVASTSTLPAGSPATVTNVGSTSAARLAFGIPKGDKGDTGAAGADGDAATIQIGQVETLLPNQPAYVVNVGSTSAAIFDIGIPKGEKGDSGSGSGDMTASTYDPNGDVASAGGIPDYVSSQLPTVNDATLTIQKNGTTVQTFTANQGSNATANITVPTKTSDITDGSGYITSSSLPGDMTGATSSIAGAHGLVPAPAAGDQDKVLKGDGTWGEVAGSEVILYVNKSQYGLNITGGSSAFTIYTDSGYTTAATLSTITDATSAGQTVTIKTNDSCEMKVLGDLGTGGYQETYFSAVLANNRGIGKLTYSGANSNWTFNPGSVVETPGSGVLTITQNGTTAGTFSANASSAATIALTDTTYSDMTGATSLDAGAHGLVPAPAAGDESKVLSGAGTWVAQTAAQVNSDWNANSGVAQILNKPTIITPLDIYPVGAIYMSVNNTNPGTLFGGTWEQIKDKFILAAGSTYSAGTTGGSATINLSHSHTVDSHNHSLPSNTGSHTLTVDQIPAHTHGTGYQWNTGSGTVRWGVSDSLSTTAATSSTGGGKGHSHTIGGNTGSKSPGTNSQLSSSQSILPPYLAVYVWKRTA